MGGREWGGDSRGSEESGGKGGQGEVGCGGGEDGGEWGEGGWRGEWGEAGWRVNGERTSGGKGGWRGSEEKEGGGEDGIGGESEERRAPSLVGRIEGKTSPSHGSWTTLVITVLRCTLQQHQNGIVRGLWHDLSIDQSIVIDVGMLGGGLCAPTADAADASLYSLLLLLMLPPPLLLPRLVLLLLLLWAAAAVVQSPAYTADCLQSLSMSDVGRSLIIYKDTDDCDVHHEVSDRLFCLTAIADVRLMPATVLVCLQLLQPVWWWCSRRFKRQHGANNRMLVG